MSDIFREVDEEVRREQLKRLWDRHGTLLIAGAVLVVVAVAGWRAYGWWEAKRAAETGAAFEAAVALSERGQSAEAQAAFAKIAVEGSAGYRALARLREAAELAKTDPKAAVERYDALSTDGSMGPVLQELAAVRAGALLVDSAGYDDLLRRLEPVSGPDRTFRHSARETLALSAWRAGNADAVRRWYDAILADPESPPSTRTRVEMLIALLAADAKG